MQASKPSFQLLVIWYCGKGSSQKIWYGTVFTAWTNSVTMDLVPGVIYCDLLRQCGHNAFGSGVRGCVRYPELILLPSGAPRTAG